MKQVYGIFLALSCLLAPVCSALAEAHIKIIDGAPLSENEYPYVARLSTGGDLLCTGTLVSSRFILTAAHCFFDDRNRRGVGDTDVVARLAGTEYTSSKVYIHPAYHPRSSACVEGETDAALIELSSDVAGITPIPLLTSPVPLGATLTLAGYGTQGSGSKGENGTIPALGTINVGSTIVEGYGESPPTQNPSSVYFFWKFDSGESNTASGDSGGPAFYDSGNQRYLAGITCGGYGNAEIGTESFDTRADLMAAWVMAVAGTTPANTAPGFATLKPLSITLGAAFSYRVPVTGSAPLQVTASGLPDGLSFDGSSISGTPTVKGSFVVSFSATNDYGSASSDLTIVVSQFDPALKVKRVLLQFDDTEDAEDFLDIDGKITLPAKFSPRGKKVLVTIGRFSKEFTLRGNGESAASGRSFFDLYGSIKRGAFARPTLQFSLTLERVALFDELATLGFPASESAVDGQIVPLPLTINIEGIEGSVTTLLKLRGRDLRWVISK